MRKTLVLFSGGYDCTGILHDLLTKTDDAVHAFHLSWSIQGHSNAAETAAVKRIIPWLYRNTRAFKFDAVTNSVSIGCGTSAFLHAGFVAALLYLRAGVKHWDRVLLGSVGPQSAQSLANNVAAQAVFDGVVEGIAVPPPWEYPYQGGEWSKAKMIATLPPELRALCWTCVKPTVVGTEFTPCGQCAKCVELEQALQEMSHA